MYAPWIFALIVLVSGCSGLSFPETPGQIVDERQLDAGPPASALQVLVTYSGLVSTHAALRLVHEERGVLFWDPAGIYGLSEADNDGASGVDEVERWNDLIVAGAPDLRVYWHFALSTGDSAMEVLEWRLPRERAENLYRVLVSGARLDGRSKDFTTDITAPFCAIGVSEFLRRFGEDPVRVSESYLFPTGLAEALRRQNPERILIFRREEPLLEFVNGRR